MTRATLWVAIVSCALIPTAGAQTGTGTPPFFAGKQISLVIGYPPGGGYDIYGRLLGRHLGKHILGHPAVVVSNMPGAGSLIFANHLYNRATRNGTVIGVVNGDAAANPLFGRSEAQYDSLKFSWIGSINQETCICLAWATAPVKTIQDAMREELIVGSATTTGITFSYPTAANFLLGTKFKIISGYGGTSKIWLAVERGELQGMCGTPWNSVRAQRPQWLQEKKINVLLQEATRSNLDLPGVPTVMDIAKNDQDRRVLELVYGWQIMGRPVVAPPGVPQDRLAALRQAFDATMKDPDFLADAGKLTLDISPLAGGEIDAFLARMYDTPKTLVDRAATALGKQK